MRPLEILLLISLPAALLLQSRNRRIFFLPIGAAALQVLLEGYRWQMLPAYILALTCLALAFGSSGSRKWLNALGSAVFLIVWGIAVMLPYLLPIPQPSSPSGPYPVGTTTLYLRDDSRTDPFAPEPDTPREFLVQLWYPAENVRDYERAPWMEDAEIVAPAVSRWIDLPAFTFNHLVYVRTDSFQDAPVSEEGGPFPLVLFSHGYGGFRAQNTFQTQQLASSGYIVAAVEHTYGSVVTVFPDGRIAKHNPETLPDDGEFEDNMEFLVNQWSGDLVYTLDTLQAGRSESDIFQDRIDFQHVGALGHSTGGGAALQFCGAEARCDSALAMDPVLLALDDSLVDSGYPKPALNLYSESWASDPDIPVLHELLANSPANVDSYSIEGTMHYDFSDLPSASPLAYQFNLKGPIDGERVLDIVNSLTIAFFDQQLKGSTSPLLSDPLAVFSELQIFRP